MTLIDYFFVIILILVAILLVSNIYTLRRLEKELIKKLNKKEGMHETTTSIKE